MDGPTAQGPAATSDPPVTRMVAIDAGPVTLAADLEVPHPSRGTVVFAHGSGSSRFSPRNRFVAARLAERGLATVLVDLLTLREAELDEPTGAFRFDVDLLARRLECASAWVGEQPDLAGLPLGYFGASTGAAAALVAAAREPSRVAAVVSRGGRPDLAGEALESVRAPTLLIVGSLDHVVIRLNQEAFERLECEKRLAIVPGAGHLFEEPGTMEAVADLAADWFLTHMPARARGRAG